MTVNMEKQNIIEIDGKKYRRLYYNICCRCALRPEVTGKPCCPIEDCDDGFYYKEAKEDDSSKERLKEQLSLMEKEFGRRTGDA